MEALQPKLRFPEFYGNWESKTLGEIFSIFNGFAFSSSDSIDDGVLWVKIADVGIQQMKKDTLSFLPFEYLKKHKKFILKKDDYVIALTRPILNGKLKIAKIDDFFDGSLLNQRVGKLLSSNNTTFVYNLLQKDLLIKSIENNISGSDPPNLSPNEISFIESHIPSVEEQTKIANFLSAVDEKLNLLKEKISLLEDYKKGIMQKIFNQDIRFKDSNGNDFEDWEEMRLGSMCKITTGKLDANAMVEGGEYRFYTCAKDYYRINKYAFDTEALLISGNGANVGYIHYYKGKFNAYQRTYILDSFKEHIIYVKYFLQINLPKRIKGEKNDGNTPYIVLSTLSEMDFLIPSYEEQTKIANFLTAIDEKIELVSNQIQDTQEYKKGLLQQMFV